MKTLKKILIPLFLVATLLLTMALASCKKECEHEYGEWTTVTDPTCTTAGESTATCTKCGETATKTIEPLGHTAGDLLCTTCGNPVITLQSLVPEISDETTSLGVVVNDVRIVNAETDISLTIAELVVYSDGEGIGGYANCEATLSIPTGGGKARSTDPTNSITISIYAFIKGENLYLHRLTSLAPEGYGDEYQVFPLSAVLEMNPQISEALAMAEMMLPTLETWINESLIPCFGEVNLPEGSEEFEPTEENAIKAATAVLDLFFRVETTEDGYAVIFDLSVFENLHNAFNEKSVAEVIDLIAGTGRFENLKKLIPTMLDYTMADLVEFVSVNLGVDITKLLAALDELAVELTGSPEATIEMLLGIEGLDDIQALLGDEDFLATNVRDFLMLAFEIEDAATLDAQIAEILTLLETVTPYQFLDMDAESVAAIGETLDAISDMISYEITVGKDGKFVSSELDVAIEEEMLYINANLTPEKFSVTLTDGVEDGNRIAFEIIPGYEPKPNTEKEATILEAFSTLPEITEEALANIEHIYHYAPVYEDGVLVGAILLTDYYYTEDDEGTPILELTTVEFNINNYSADLRIGCSGKIEIGYTMYGATVTCRNYAIDTESVGEDEEAYAVNLYETSDDYVIEYDFTDYFSFSVCYDTVAGEYVDSADHELSYSEEDSVTPDACGKPGKDVYICDVCGMTITENYIGDHNYEYSEEDSIVVENCGEEGKYVYICTDCGDVAEEEYIVEHDIETSAKKTVYDEETSTFTCSIICECGEVISVTVVHVEGELPLEYRETENTSKDALEFSFNLPEAGNYEISLYSEYLDGYIHLYSGNGYVSTPYFSSGEELIEEHYLSGTSCYFSLRFYDDVVEREITISIRPVDTE